MRKFTVGNRFEDRQPITIEAEYFDTTAEEVKFWKVIDGNHKCVAHFYFGHGDYILAE